MNDKLIKELPHTALALLYLAGVLLFGLVRTASRRLAIISGLDIVSGILFNAMALRKAL